MTANVIKNVFSQYGTDTLHIPSCETLRCNLKKEKLLNKETV